MPLGMLEASRYRAGTIQIRPGAVLAMFSDGIPEAENPHGDFYRTERLRDLLLAERGRPAQAIVDRVRSDLFEFTQDTPPSDDVTILLLRRRPVAPEAE